MVSKSDFGFENQGVWGFHHQAILYVFRIYKIYACISLFLPLNFDFRTGVFDMKEQNKTTNIIIRISPDEKQHIQEQAALAHMNVSEFILAATQNKKIVVKDEIPQLLLA
ncbi:MAG: DUF1778 domain-containing protein, partial [Clostridia bacterium]|nr:DUF1778 domain-containing protein [Clostridia bacterium]